jgi:tetratricopeptide (TPR) repeat protein
LRAFIAAFLLLSTTALAESPVEKEARERYSAAQKLFDQARYEEAAAEFQKSYELSRYPAILHKIALSYDQLGNLDKAIEFYQKYLDADPKSERRAGIEARIAKLKEQQQPAPSPTPTAPPAAVVAPQATAVTAAPAPRKTPVYKKWWLWTIVGVAAAGLAVGLGVGLAPPSSPTPSSFNPTLGRVGPGK